MITVSFHESTEDEINEAVDFYEMECLGLGSLFIDELEKALERISQIPQSSQILRGNIRKKVLHKFPYSVIYSIRSSKIRVLAVAHQKKRPFYWRRRR
jgi:plasmid stabilization system protein ParE